MSTDGNEQEIAQVITELCGDILRLETRIGAIEANVDQTVEAVNSQDVMLSAFGEISAEALLGRKPDGDG